MTAEAGTRLERHCGWLVRTYPPAYRRRRGEEIVGTLLDLSPVGAAWPPLVEAGPVVAAGLRRRIGVAADQPLGALVDLVGGWYLALAAVLSGGALLFGDWAPWLPRPFWTFGPFLTDAVPCEVAVLLAALAWTLGQPGPARALAVIAALAGAATVVLGRITLLWPRPSLSFLVPTLLLLVPTIVRAGAADRPAGAARRAARSVVGAVCTGLGAFTLIDGIRDARIGPGVDLTPSLYYRGTLIDVARAAPVAGAVALGAAVVLGLLRRRVEAGGVLAAVAPWLLLAVLTLGRTYSFYRADARAALAELAVCLPVALVSWVRGATRPAVLDA